VPRCASTPSTPRIMATLDILLSLVFLIVACPFQVKARAMEVFHSVDEDGGGTLDMSELRECFKRMGTISPTHPLTHSLTHQTNRQANQPHDQPKKYLPNLLCLAVVVVGSATSPNLCIVPPCGSSTLKFFFCEMRSRRCQAFR
jgi:hypothetical protein